MELEQLKSDARVLQIFQERVHLKKDSNGWFGKCPFHSENTGSFRVSDKEGHWLYKCFGCGQGGSVIDFVQKLDNLSTKDAIQRLKTRLGILQSVTETFKPLAENKFKLTKEQYSKFEHLPPNAVMWLESRGVSLETAEKLQIGFKGDELIFPIIRGGEVIGLKFRKLETKDFRYQPGMSNGLFNLDAVDPFRPVFLVEGEMDVLAMAEADQIAVALPGASYKLKPEEIKALKASDGIILAGDSDQPGQEKMQQLWRELGNGSFLLQWPHGTKDANELLMKRGVKNFQQEVQKLEATARMTPMAHVQSLRESLENSQRLRLSDHPDRLKMPWPTVDKMANLLPGSVMVVSTTNTKQGKTAWVKDITLHNAFRGEVVLNYGCELSVDEFACTVAAGLLNKHRNHLTEKDNKEAAKMLGNIRYYYGRNPSLTTVSPVLDLIEEAVKTLGATVVVIDHIHFLCRNSNTEIQDQANAMQRLKNLAVKYNLKVIVVAQPRKAKQENKGKALHITDLKGSETLGSDADAVFALHREFIKDIDPSNPPMDAYQPLTGVNLVGVRSKGDGPSYCELLFLGEYAKFVEPEKSVDNTEELW